MQINLSPFLNALKIRLNEYKERNGFTYFKEFDTYATEGSKFFKVFRVEVDFKESAQNRSIVAFVDKQTGDIFKPASFNAPAKHSRGNTGSPSCGMEAIDASGHVIYLRG